MVILQDLQVSQEKICKKLTDCKILLVINLEMINSEKINMPKIKQLCKGQKYLLNIYRAVKTESERQLLLSMILVLLVFPDG